MTDRKIKNEPETGYRLVGVASALKEYRFCFQLNQILCCDFQKLKDISFETSDSSRNNLFGVFRAERETDEICFTVFANKIPGAFLLPEVNNFDFIVRVDGRFSDEKMKQTTDDLQALPDMLMVAEIPLKKIKNRERLIYEEEKPSRKSFKSQKS
ncbi:MAG: IPExxxVDY family protein [Bacteroidetes bacterium]|nr:IPExxxVDY family protein [Bacteroidota bacterium]